ncbi:O-antigen polysaccharide polymerase Wzy [Flavobacteriaceae bacterium GSB9]|nr:O-antigen polysaccharide polymerase Wzy [Flavobacteriaceae bacterium GSB9]
MKLKTLTIFLYLMVSIPLFLFFKANVFVWFSFFINYCLITYISYFHLNKERIFSPFLTSYIVFVFLFFIVAPIIQIGAIESMGSTFPNNYPYNVNEVIFSNFLILIFNLIFFISYLFYKKRKEQNFVQKPQTNTFSRPLVMLVLFMVCFVIWAINYSYIIDEISKSIYSKEAESISILLIRKKVLFLIPLGAIALIFRYLKKNRKITTNTFISYLMLIILLSFLLFFKNPLTEKRNALGPIYITLIYLFYPKLINTNSKFFLFSFVSMIIFFPLVSALTHVDANLSEIIQRPNIIVEDFTNHGGIVNAFSTLHYDAFPNIVATVSYVGKEGLSLGYQLLSGLLFFIPRSLWSTKPLSTGEFIGNFLMENHEFTYNNLSNPLVSEGYVNFGILGVVLMSILLSYVVAIFISWLKSNDTLKEVIAFYFSVHLIFLLRGDFANGFAYFVGTFIGVYFIPKLLERIIFFSLKKTK